MNSNLAYLLYLRAAENLADVSASRQLDDAMLSTAKAALRNAQQAYWDAVDAKPQAVPAAVPAPV